jgi:hypothetical protein
MAAPTHPFSRNLRLRFGPGSTVDEHPAFVHFRISCPVQATELWQAPPSTTRTTRRFFSRLFWPRMGHRKSEPPVGANSATKSIYLS